jgi:hypothetical protein
VTGRTAPSLLAALALTGCLPRHHLNVDITTRVQPDGSCLRRIEYRLERRSDDTVLEIPAGERPLRELHRFPAGEGWSVREDYAENLHTVIVEGSVPSPAHLDGDYSRAAVPGGRVARNHVSFDRYEGSYSYLETFIDPASPLAAARVLSQSLLKRQDEMAEGLEQRLGDPQVRRQELKRLLRTHVLLPLSEEVVELAGRAVYGPRERREEAEALDKLTGRAERVVDALQALLPGRERKELDEALEHTLEAWADGLEAEMQNAGLPMPIPELRAKVHYRVTLTLPAPIVRANTCVTGDTATWEFEGEDLYGRGFEMWARAVNR